MADIRIENKKDSVLWTYNVSHLKKDMRVIVDNNLVALCYCDGKYVNQFFSNEIKILNESNVIVKTFGRKVQADFYVFNNQTEFEIKWGVGKNPVAYIDKRLRGAKLELTAHGFCRVKIINPKLLMDKMPSSTVQNGNITAAQIVDFLQRELIVKVPPHLTEATAKVGDYMFMPAKLNELTDSLTFSLTDFNEYGVRVLSSVIEGLDYTEDSRTLINKETTIISSKMDTEIVSEKAKQKDMMKD